MDPQAMRFLNLLGNKFFALLLSKLMGQSVKDSLCGTKVLWRETYLKLAAGRAYFGDFDPFGDFDLLFGAAKLNLKITDIPIRYRQRVYGSTNITVSPMVVFFCACARKPPRSFSSSVKPQLIRKFDTDIKYTLTCCCSSLSFQYDKHS